MPFKGLNKGDFSTHTHTQVRFAEKKIIAESGRSMVEMLGALAIIGILSMVGIKAFNAGMTQHRANELLNEAQKRAVVVAAQIMAGREKNALSVAEFPNPDGYTFGVEANTKNEKQFNITITGVAGDVCQKMKNMVDEGTVVRVISEFCDKLTFNNDLSGTPYASDYNRDESICTGEGYTWCSNGDDGVLAKCSGTNNCCATVTYDAQCETCDPVTGKVSNKTGNCTYTYANGTTSASTCSAGICVDPAITTSTLCLTNADCGGVGSGYYCAYSGYSEACTEDVRTAMGCAGITNPAECAKAGTCTKVVSAWSTLLKAKVTGLGTLFVSPGSMEWWDAKNWCEAFGKQLVSVEDVQAYGWPSGSQATTEMGGTMSAACAKGKKCAKWNSSPYDQMWDGNTLTDAKDADGELYRAKFSPVMVALAMQLKSKKDFLWTSSNYRSSNFCDAIDIRLSDSSILNTYRWNQRGGALCK